MASKSPRDHVAEIRRSKFSIGGEANPLTEDLHQAVKNLSAELYAKDVHFLMELIQNAEDNEYPEQVDPSLEFVITSKDITATGAPATLLIFNNEKGFSPKNIDSVCSVGRSTKKGNRKRGYIGEKGIGFKSVFIITARPHIFSNGYQIRFNEEPCGHCNLGYIVPEWVDENPSLSQVRQIYGSASSLPTTILILPLKPDKVNPVKQQLSSIHPQVLLFLSKIKKLSVREENEDLKLKTVNGIAITKETDFKQSKSIDAESFTLHLSADENGTGKESSYYMWKQKFPVQNKYRVERRSEIEELVITLAFPNGEGLRQTANSPGIYAFLPTEMVTNFPFIIQADFLLASSRETILLDSKWNQGILQCVPVAFVSAFKSLVDANRDAPAWMFPDMFRFFPIAASNYQELNVVRERIRAKLGEEEILPSEVLVKQKFFHKPRDVGRLIPSFWSILHKAREEKVSLLSLSSHGKYILSSSFDKPKYDHVLEFLQVQPVPDEWYAKCIQGSSLGERVSDDVYLKLLLFIAENWNSKFHSTNIKNIPLIRYEDLNGNRSLFTMSSSVTRNGEGLVYLSRRPDQAPWLIGWNREFGSVTNLLFVPKVIQEAVQSCPKKEIVLQWLQDYVKVGLVDVNEFGCLLCKSITKDPKLVVSYAHFLYQSRSRKEFLTTGQVDKLCGAMPLVNSYGNVTTQRSGVLVPASRSKWAGLVLSNLWKDEGYVELSGDYLTPFRVAGKLITPENELLGFLKVHAGADDVPSIALPNSPIPSAAATLTKENAFLLLDWIRNQKYQSAYIPNRFIKSVKDGSWMKITLNGCPGSRPPSQSFLLSASLSWGNVLQNGSVLVDIPMVDQSYYGDGIMSYKEELKTIGVMTEFAEACHFIGNRLMHLASSCSLTRGNVLSILRFIKFLRANCLPPEEFINSIKTTKWLRTSWGDRAPHDSVLSDEKWSIVQEICDIPFIDQEYYGDEIREFAKELELLGVLVSFGGIEDARTHQLIVENLSLSLSGLSARALLLLLQCLRRKSDDKIVKAMKGAKCLKTRVGYSLPGESILCDPEWGCLFQVFNGLPLIDPVFYGESKFVGYKSELKRIGVIVDFDAAVKKFAPCFRDHASRKSMSKDNVMSFLSCYRKLKTSTAKFPADLKDCVCKEKWLRTRHCDYYRSPKECVLYSPEWDSISPIARIPFIDDTDSCYGKAIHWFKKELKDMGVVVDFKEGVKFVAAGLYFRDVTCVTRENALSLLGCIGVLNEKKIDFPEEFSKKLSQPWLRTSVGYRSPDKCLLFCPEFAQHLKKTDGPFLDDEFYGAKLSSYRETLGAIGVVVNVEKGYPLIANQLGSQSEFATIERLYSYLSAFNWKPKTESERKIWIPNGNHKGEWVSPEDCVVSDKSGLFTLQLKVLDKFYQKNLCFFSDAFEVKCTPDTEDYCELWKSWESSDRLLTRDECCKFWTYINKRWTKSAEKTLPEEITKVPVKSGSDGIMLVNKKDVFVADDLQLKELFEQSCSRAIFVWYPQPSFPSLSRTKLLEIFQKIGVRPISESVEREEVSVPNGVEHEQEEILSNKLIVAGLVKLVLGFLADPSMEMEAKERQKVVESLLKLTVVETAEPINVSYNLSFSSGETLNVRASRMVRWERESMKLFTQKMGSSEGGAGELIERATYFSQVVAEGVLWENGDRVYELSELIKLAFLLDFDDHAVAFLMKSKNLQIFEEDETFLASAFPSN